MQRWERASASTHKPVGQVGVSKGRRRAGSKRDQCLQSRAMSSHPDIAILSIKTQPSDKHCLQGTKILSSAVYQLV